MLGERIKQARESAGLSLRALGERAGVTAMAISKYERDESTPSSKVLIGLSKALGVRTEYFFRGARVTLERPDYRKHPKLPKKEHDKVIADVTDQVERRMALGKVLPEAWELPFDRPKFRQQVATMDDIEVVADKARSAWDLGTNPIQDLMDTLEEHGLKVFTTRFGDAARFDGLTASVQGMPLVVVGEGKGWVGDRQRFTLAHELGHQLLEGRLPKGWGEDEIERACHRFAGAFLVPASEVRQALGNKRNWLEPQELYQLKHEYGLSMNAWSFRARDLGIITQQTFGKYWGLVRKRGWKEREPGDQYPVETARRFKQLVYRALAEEMIGESKAAELLGQSIQQLKAERGFTDDSGAHSDDVADQ
ncbi:MAG: helix-turn-helix domain-containing protein [Gammaproteobacteria bacterium]